MSSLKTVRIYRDWHDSVPVFCRVQTVHLDTDLEVPEELYNEYLEASNALIELEERLINWNGANRD